MHIVGRFPSGQREQTVNLPSQTSVVRIHPCPPTYAGMAELADALDSGSSVRLGHAGSSPVSRTKGLHNCNPFFVQTILKLAVSGWLISNSSFKIQTKNLIKQNRLTVYFDLRPNSCPSRYSVARKLDILSMALGILLFLVSYKPLASFPCSV